MMSFLFLYFQFKKDLITPSAPPKEDDKGENDEAAENDDKHIQMRNNGALHVQCINELSSNLRRCVSEIPPEISIHPSTENPAIERNSFGNNSHISRSRSNSLSENRSKSPSHFITVIELKEDRMSSGTEKSAVTMSSSTTTATSTVVASTKSSFADVKRNFESSNDSEEVPKASDLLASIHEAKKKIPPRPPPKIATRRVEPPVVPPSATKKYEETPDSSLERNIKPSDIFRQKSNESLESRSSGSGKVASSSNIENSSKVKPSDLREEFERRLHKSESLEKTKTKNTDSPTGSLGKISVENSSNKCYRVGGTGSLDKAAFKGSDSLKTTDSRESLISNGANSDKMKSYESASSVESLRNIEESYLDREPYYDTVPVEDETLTMPSRSYKNSERSSSQVDPESPGHHSNYVNINYFLE